MIENLELPENRFNQPLLPGLKQKTFIFGKNGTGKSSITQCIKDSYSNEYDIRIFQGYEQIITEQGGDLNVISLGTENTELQPEIDKIQTEISNLEQELEENKETVKQKSEVLRNNEKNLDEFYKSSAKKLKDEHLLLFGSGYNKNNFKNSISMSHKASENEVNNAQKNREQNTLDIKAKINYSPLNSVNDLVQPLNNILNTKIIESAILNFSTQERIWVQNGLHLHNDRTHCLFCNSLLNKDRMKDLNTYFSEAIKSLNNEINSYEEKLKNSLETIRNLNYLDNTQYFSTFSEHINDLNGRLATIKDNINNFLALMQKRLTEKKINLYSVPPLVELIDMTSIEEFIKEYDLLYEENKKNNNNIEKIKQTANNLLCKHYVALECEASDYKSQENSHLVAQAEYNDAKNALTTKEKELLKYKNNLQELKRQTINEDLAAEYINNFIKGLGNHSFTLANSSSTEQKGVYQILDYQGNPRKIETLSTGEKNIVAFLWFIYHLQDSNEPSEKKQIIIFDDPMNSNDDTTQYLIISELQKLLTNTKSQVFILTHNAHFYINTRYNCWSKDKSNKATFRLVKNGVRSDVIRVDEKNDIKTSYEGLWDELNWLYTYSNKPEYLLNPIRRILETYRKFNQIESFYQDHKEAEKLFNVNSHGIDDLESDLNGKSKDEIIKMLQFIFEKHNALNHFRTYFAPYSDDTQSQ